uniref:Coiled-coil and C2 domain containing 1A n=1 Tax=Sphenodon punctatus TaxID=8508 RepID=A0A8D0L6P8_SPHPU
SGLLLNAGENDSDLEAEFMAIVGGQPETKEKPNGKTPLPMEAIERMAALCMKDLDEGNEEDEEGEEDLEEDDDLMVNCYALLFRSCDGVRSWQTNEAPPAGSASVESTLEERLDVYRAAVANAKQTGESSKVRRYERGLKTLENMLTSVRKGRKIDEEEIPPPVAVGKGVSSQQPTPSSLTPVSQASTQNGNSGPPSLLLARSPSPVSASSPPVTSPVSPPPVAPKPLPPLLPKPKISPPLSMTARSPEAPQEKTSPPAPSSNSGSEKAGTQALLQARQREYKLAALQAKQQGSLEMASKYYRIAKTFDPILDALSKGESVDLGCLPPPPGENQNLALPDGQSLTEKAPADAISLLPPPPPDIPPPPRDMLEALQQRMERYKTAAAQAKSKGDGRKARMHERIVKQYQEAIQAHKAGKPVDFVELPVPPGFPPIQGMESSSGDQSIVGVLETALKLANQEDEEDDNAEETRKVSPFSVETPTSYLKKNCRIHAALLIALSLSSFRTAQQQLAFLENRRKQLMQSALRAKQQNDIEGAKLFLRQAKGLDPMIEASQNGLPVDITKVPQAPVNKEDFLLVRNRGVSVSPEAAAQYVELMNLMRQQHEMCMNYSKQFTHLGNITETVKFEKMAEDCKKNMEILKQAHAKGFPLPKFHYEQRTFSVVKIFPELNSNDMILYVVKGINLPAPPGVTPNDLDAFVRFEFAYPNAVSDEFGEQFKLFINRGHRGLKRAIQTKSIKFEVVHKGGLFKPDRVVATAQLKLEVLETRCEIREIIELLDGRRPTGGKLEVIVRLREPLSSQQLETTTEKWLVIDPLTMPPCLSPCSKLPSRLHSLSVLAFEKEKLERKILAYKQAGKKLPNELAEQHRDLVQRSQWHRSQLQHGGPAFRKEYLTQLEQYQHFYTEAARRLGKEGNRVRDSPPSPSWPGPG